MFRGIAFIVCLTTPTWVCAQQITVEVWNLALEGRPAVPSSAANVRRYRAANQRPAPDPAPQRPVAAGPRKNEYVLDASGLGPLVDIIVNQQDYHVWTVRDLFVAPGSDQRIVVQLFKRDFPIKAPECFALKTQYELLFRTEQRLNPNARKKEVERSARLKYADGLLALPNPSRYEYQHPWVEQMLNAMEPDDQGELNNMLNGLFDLYEMDAMAQFVPTRWDTTFESPNGPVRSEVRLYGTYGEYTTEDGRSHQLNQMDIYPEDTDNGGEGYVIEGTWRFRNPPSTGTFRWLVDQELNFNGSWQYAGENRRRPWTGRQVEQIKGGSPPPPTEAVGGAAPPRIPAPAPPAEAVPTEPAEEAPAPAAEPAPQDE